MDLCITVNVFVSDGGCICVLMCSICCVAEQRWVDLSIIGAGYASQWAADGEQTALICTNQRFGIFTFYKLHLRLSLGSSASLRFWILQYILGLFKSGISYYWLKHCNWSNQIYLNHTGPCQWSPCCWLCWAFKKEKFPDFLKEKHFSTIVMSDGSGQCTLPFVPTFWLEMPQFWVKIAHTKTPTNDRTLATAQVADQQRCLKISHGRRSLRMSWNCTKNNCECVSLPMQTNVNLEFHENLDICFVWWEYCQFCIPWGLHMFKHGRTPDQCVSVPFSSSHKSFLF